MNRQAFVLAVFFSLTPITIFASLVFLLNYQSTPVKVNPGPSVLGETYSGFSAHAQPPLLVNSSENIKSIAGEPLAADARPVIIRQYLERWKSPLISYSDLIVSASDQHGVNPLLVVAIAQQESNLGKKDKPGCFNAWGWAQTSIYTRCFSSWEDGIKTFIKEFSEKYIQKGLLTPEDIMVRYNPISPNGAWARGVSQFLNELSDPSSS